MAKAKYGGGIQDLRGSIAGQVHSRNTYGNYIRQKVSPVQPRTQRQLEIRELFTTLSRRFSNVLTDEQQEAWRQAAASTPIRDVFGDSIALTGINLYNRLNSLRVLAGLAPLDWPPSAQEVPALTTFTLNSAIDAWELSVDFAPTPIPASHYLFIWATEPLNPGVAFVNHKLRLIAVLPPGTASPATLNAAYVDRYGGLIPGKAIYLAGELVHETGWKGPRSLTKVRITG
jgi:hypothetical protein